MKLSLLVRDVPNGDKRTLYTYEMTGLEQLLPEGAWVAIAYGKPADDHGISMYVRRSYLDAPEHSFVSELREVIIDPPEHWGLLRGNEIWRSEVDPDLCANYHENLLVAGWTEYQ